MANTVDENEEFDDEFDFDEDDNALFEEAEQSAQLDSDSDDLDGSDDDLKVPSVDKGEGSRNLPIAVVSVLVLGFLGYKSLGWFSSSEPAPEKVDLAQVTKDKGTTSLETPLVAPQLKKEAVEAAVEPIPTPVVVEKIEAAVEQAVVNAPVKEDAAPWLSMEKDVFDNDTVKTEAKAPTLSADDVLKKLQSQDEVNSKKFTNLENTLEDVVETISSMGSGVGRLDKDMSALQSSLRSIQVELGNIRDAVKKSGGSTNNTAAPMNDSTTQARPAQSSGHVIKPPAPPKQEPAFTNPSFSVYAIIPGRAWLRSPDGQTTTVTEGDTVARYGKVLVIDAPSGVVITSSGITLR